MITLAASLLYSYIAGLWVWATCRRLNASRSEEHTSELQSQSNLVCRLLLEKNKRTQAELEPHRPLVRELPDRVMEAWMDMQHGFDETIGRHAAPAAQLYGVVGAPDDRMRLQ